MDPRHPHKSSMLAHFCNPKAGCDGKAEEDSGSLLAKLAHMVSSRISERPCFKNMAGSGRGRKASDGNFGLYRYPHMHITHVCTHRHTYKKIYQVLWEF